MDERKVMLLYDSCRLCLKNQAFVNMFQTIDLVDDIFLCTGVKVSRSDNLPQKICMSCLEIVTNAKRLRILAITNDKTMRSLLDGEDGSMDQGNNHLILGSPLPINNLYDTSTEICEVAMNKSGCGNEEAWKSNNNSTTDLITGIKEESKTIFVRKDLFDSPPAVSSSMSEETYLEEKVSKEGLKLEAKEFNEYTCEICDKTFDKWKKLYCHQRSHNKNIACPQDACGKLFATKGDLEKHFRTHTGERPYRCDLCDRRFVQRVTLKSHRISVHAVHVDT